MADYTGFLRLGKPAKTDRINVDVINENMGKIEDFAERASIVLSETGRNISVSATGPYYTVTNNNADTVQVLLEGNSMLLDPGETFKMNKDATETFTLEVTCASDVTVTYFQRNKDYVDNSLASDLANYYDKTDSDSIFLKTVDFGNMRKEKSDSVCSEVLPLKYNACGNPVEEYRIYGDTSQMATPTPTSAVIPIGTGDLVTDSESEHYGEYALPIINNSIAYNVYLATPLYRVNDKSDYIDYARQKVIRNVGIITYDGSTDEAWENYEYKNYRIDLTNLGGGDNPHVSYEVLCDKLLKTSEDNLGIVTNRIAICDGKVCVHFDSTLTTVSEYKAYLQSNPITVYYPLASEVTEDVTLPDIPTISGENQLYVDTTVTPKNVVVGALMQYLTRKDMNDTLTAHTGNADIHVTSADKTAWDGKQDALTAAQLEAVDSGIDSTKVAQIETNKNDISSIQQEQIVQNTDIATLRLALDTKIYGIRIDKQDTNPDKRVTYLYDAVGMTPAYMDFDGGSFSYGSWADIWFVKNNRPVALKFDGTVDYELNHTDFTKKLDGTASEVSDPDYGGNFMSEMPTVYVKRWEDSRYNYIAFSDKQVNSDFLAQAHTNANDTVNSAIYLPMFKGWKDSNNKLRSLMGTYPTGDTTGTNEVTYASNNGTGWQIWDKAKIDLIMDLIMLITKSTNCRAKIGNGDCSTYNESDTTNYGKLKSGYETDGTTRSASAQFYGSEGTEVTGYGKHHMIAFYIEDLWANRSDRCLGFNLVDNVYKVKMTAPYVLDSDSSYGTFTVAPPSSTEGWLKNVSSANAYGVVPTEVGESNISGFANYFYKSASGSRLSLFGGHCNYGLRVGRCWLLYRGSGDSDWRIGGSPCYNNPS